MSGWIGERVNYGEEKEELQQADPAWSCKELRTNVRDRCRLGFIEGEYQ